MRKLVVPLLLLLLLAGCTGGNRAPLSTPMPSASAPVPEETISIQPEELLLTVGETASLVCQSPSGTIFDDVTWTIEDESVATISHDGTVTAVSKGETTGIAERKDGTDLRATCRITVEDQKTLSFDGAKVEIDGKMEGVISQDGTNCTMVFEMHAVSDNGVFKGQAMLQSIGVKDAGGSIPAVGMIGLVSKAEFALEPYVSEEQSTDGGDDEIELVPLIDVDYSGKGIFRFILTDVGFMALETHVQDDDVFIEVPFEVIVADDVVGIGFSAPDGQYLTFQGKLLKP